MSRTSQGTRNRSNPPRIKGHHGGTGPLDEWSGQNPWQDAGVVLGFGQAWERRAQGQKHLPAPLPLPIPPPCWHSEPSFSGQHCIVKYPDPSPDSLQILLHGSILYSIFHKASCYFSDDSLVSSGQIFPFAGNSHKLATQTLSTESPQHPDTDL